MSNNLGPRWRKSTFSANDADCVELAWLGPEAAIRDSKFPHSNTLRIPTPTLKHLLSHTKHS